MLNISLDVAITMVAHGSFVISKKFNMITLQLWEAGSKGALSLGPLFARLAHGGVCASKDTLVRQTQLLEICVPATSTAP
jgi:hypothetical protein